MHVRVKKRAIKMFADKNLAISCAIFRERLRDVSVPDGGGGGDPEHVAPAVGALLMDRRTLSADTAARVPYFDYSLVFANRVDNRHLLPDRNR